MKKTIYIFMILSILGGCKKGNNGNLLFTITYNNSTNTLKKGNAGLSQKSIAADADFLNTEFGSYITSITPDKFICKFERIAFIDEKPRDKGGHSLELFDPNSAQDDPQRFADFSNNNVVSMTPDLGSIGMIGNDGLLIKKEINFIYFYFRIFYFYQELELPVQYKTINLNQLSNSVHYPVDQSGNVKIENILKMQHYPLVGPLFDKGWPNLFVFGNTNTTSVVYIDETNIGSFGSPFIDAQGEPIIWSNKYNSFILISPGFGETKTINTTVSFNTTNLIQIYAGNDNIAYTSDDVIVYAPNFWERISVDVDIN